MSFSASRPCLPYTSGFPLGRERNESTHSVGSVAAKVIPCPYTRVRQVGRWRSRYTRQGTMEHLLFIPVQGCAHLPLATKLL